MICAVAPSAAVLERLTSYFLEALYVTVHWAGVLKRILQQLKQLGLVTGPHCLRHTFISEVEKRNGAGVARDCANHSSLRITNRYDHSHPEQLSKAVNTLPW